MKQKYLITIPVVESIVYLVWAESRDGALGKIENHLNTNGRALPTDKTIRCGVHGGSQTVVGDTRAWTVRELD